MSTKAAEDLGGVIVRTVEFVSDHPQEGEGAHRLIQIATRDREKHVFAQTRRFLGLIGRFLN